MRLKTVRDMIKALGDDTRLRIIHLLSLDELNVTELCNILGTQQPNLSKHLLRLRLAGLIKDRREGMNVYYDLSKPAERPHRELLRAVTSGCDALPIFKEDEEQLERMKQE